MRLPRDRDSEFPDSVDIALFRQTIGRDLLDFCVVEYLLHHRFKGRPPAEAHGHRPADRGAGQRASPDLP